MNATMTSPPIAGLSREDTLPGDAMIGQVYLRVAELDRAIHFYRGALGFKVVFYGPDAVLPVVFLATGNYQHHVALKTLAGIGGAPSLSGHTPLLYLAILYPGELCLASAAAQVMNRGYSINSARDHGTTLSVYLQDPDDNGIELYYDRPRQRRLDSASRSTIESEPLNLEAWMRRALSARGTAFKSAAVPAGLAAQDFSEVL